MIARTAARPSRPGMIIVVRWRAGSPTAPGRSATSRKADSQPGRARRAGAMADIRLLVGYDRAGP
ncbi:MAG: hypothetical protein JO345_16615 [Streptosporangiaceae bacterium]|nr:hypothetical protein [Streptosporangiaceae bacterium]